MRKGGRRIEWTTADVRYLRESAGLVPKREICRRLKRSAKAVERKAAQMRAQGEAVDLRCFRSELALCPSCGCMRATVAGNRFGICEPCRRRTQLAAIEGRVADLMAELPEEERRVYEDTEAEREARVIDPMPSKRPTRGLSRYEAAKAEDDYDRAMERWLAARYARAVKSAQKRKERIEKKVKTNGCFHETPDERPREPKGGNECKR